MGDAETFGSRWAETALRVHVGRPIPGAGLGSAIKVSNWTATLLLRLDLLLDADDVRHGIHRAVHDRRADGLLWLVILLGFTMSDYLTRRWMDQPEGWAQISHFFGTKSQRQSTTIDLSPRRTYLLGCAAGFRSTS